MLKGYTMKIRAKLLMSFFVMIVLLFSIALFAYINTSNSQSAYQEMLNDSQLRYQLSEIRFRLAGMSNDERAYLLSGDEQFAAKIRERQDEISQFVADIYFNESLNSDDETMLAEFEQHYADYLSASEQVIGARGEGNVSEAQAIHFVEGMNARQQADGIIDEMTSKLIEEINVDVENNQSNVKLQTIFMTIIFIGAVIIAIAVGWLLSRSITKPLQTVNKQLKEIADGHGDLSTEINLHTKDEVGEVANSFNQMIRNLRSILSQAKDTSIQVASSSEQLAASAEQSTRATEVIMEMTQTIAVNSEKEQQHVTDAVKSIQQMSEGIQQVSKGSEEVYQLAQKANEASSSGASAVQNVLHEMNDIHQTVKQASKAIISLGGRSQQINGITSTITDIANRTNLLSLNAAIEAARAGEHGRGFAVVANEIRKLAEQSGQSAKQIAELIEEIVQETEQAATGIEAGTVKVVSGLTKTEQVDKVFRSIQSNVSAVTGQAEHMSSIALELAASSNQMVTLVEGVSSASSDVAAACQNSSASTEEQLASMEEITTSSQALTKLAEDLHGVLSRFKLE